MTNDNQNSISDMTPILNVVNDINLRIFYDLCIEKVLILFYFFLFFLLSNYVLLEKCFIV